jgi:AcrR family transcriptional regulator
MEQSAERRWGARTGGERRAARRAAIMDAAIALYGEVGYRNTSVKAVCTAAGLTERYFYESFSNSEALLQACFLHVTQALMARMREAAGDDGRAPLERVRAGLLVYFTDLRKNPAAARVFLMEMSSVSPATAAVVSQSLDAFGQLLMDVLRGAEAGGLPYSPLLLRGVVGGGLHIAQAWIEGGYASSVQDAVEAAVRLYGLMTCG